MFDLYQRRAEKVSLVTCLIQMQHVGLVYDIADWWAQNGITHGRVLNVDIEVTGLEIE